MLKVTNLEVTGFVAAIRGMRNPMNSWAKSDSLAYDDIFVLGDNDLKLMKQLAAGGPVHAKYRRFIDVTMDILAPLYWWKDFDTYKIGTTANGCSTMHKIHAKEFKLDDFSHEHLLGEGRIPDHAYQNSHDILSLTVESLNFYRQKFLEIDSEIKKCHFNDLEKREELVKSKKEYWWQMIQLLPTSYNQLRTVHLNYEVAAHIIHDRENHKLDEWHVLCDELKRLPYADGVIFNIRKDS